MSNERFHRETWRAQIASRLSSITSNLTQEMRLIGCSTVLSYLTVRTLEPLVEAFQDDAQTIEVVQVLAEIHNGPGAGLIIRRAGQVRYQLAMFVERELRISAVFRQAVAALLVELGVISLARQRLSRTLDERLHQRLLADLDRYGAREFGRLREMLYGAEWQVRPDTLRQLRAREHGDYSEAELQLLQNSLNDQAGHVRAEAARIVGQMEVAPPDALLRALVRVALYDIDLESRTAAAASMGRLRQLIISPQLVEQLEICLSHEDHFVRTASAQIFCRLGERAASPSVMQKLLILLSDPAPFTREMAAHALGAFGSFAAVPKVMTALRHALDDADFQVHEAASAALLSLRQTRTRTGLLGASLLARSTNESLDKS